MISQNSHSKPNINDVPVLKIQIRGTDLNSRGDGFGGFIINNIDIAGGITATIATKGMTATKAVKELVFIQPTFAHDLLSFFAEVVEIGTTSITIKVNVFAQRMPSDELLPVASAILVFVAINKPGEKRIIEK